MQEQSRQSNCACGRVVVYVGRGRPPTRCSECARDRRIGARAEQKRRWDRENKPPCPQCGEPMARGYERCARCRREADAAAVDERRREILRRWLAGESHRQIAAALGTSAPTIQVELVRMRQDGWDAPRRGPRGRILDAVA
jgi:DNA-binding CsgD family transcriptional regulator